MKFELTNTEREYFGLQKVQSHWDKVQLTKEIFLYFNNNTIVKSISVNDHFYKENEMNEETENREILLPKTKKGKPKKLNFSSFQSRNGIGTYFSYDSGLGVRIGNYTTQKTFYSTDFERIKIETFEELQLWITKFINESTEEDKSAILKFSQETRKNVKVKEGDFFCFKVDRRNYGFGRVLLDIRKLRKDKTLQNEKHYGLNQLMGQPLAIKVYHKISSNPDVDLNEIKNLKCFPSQYIMDNTLFYGDYTIIGNVPLENNELEFPMSYSRCISSSDKNAVYLQWGLIYKQTDIGVFDKYLLAENQNSTNENNKTIVNPFRNEGIGFGINLNKEILLKCIEEGNNEPFWNERFYARDFDLRNPKNQKIKDAIFTQFNLNSGLTYAENLVK